jgi:predicted nucleic acid-binding protein
VDRVLVDTSAWVEFFRHPHSIPAAVVEDLLDRDLVCTTGVVVAELLQGTRNPKESETLLTRFQPLDRLETTFDLLVAAGQVASSLRRRGVILPLTDLIVAVVAHANNCSIYTLDSHFDRIPHSVLYQPK